MEVGDKVEILTEVPIKDTSASSAGCTGTIVSKKLDMFEISLDTEYVFKTGSYHVFVYDDEIKVI